MRIEIAVTAHGAQGQPVVNGVANIDGQTRYLGMRKRWRRAEIHPLRQVVAIVVAARIDRSQTTGAGAVWRARVEIVIETGETAPHIGAGLLKSKCGARVVLAAVRSRGTDAQLVRRFRVKRQARRSHLGRAEVIAGRPPDESVLRLVKPRHAECTIAAKPEVACAFERSEVIGAVTELDIGASVFIGFFAVNLDRAANVVAPVERSLGPTQNLDALYIQ